MSEYPADQKRSAGLFRSHAEGMAWAALVTLSLLSLNGVVITLGLMVLVLPGVLLLLCPNLLIVAILLQPARFLRRWSPASAVLAALTSLMALALIPALSNASLEGAVVAERAGDFDRGAPAPSASVLLLREKDLECDATCQRLLDGGVTSVSVGVLTGDTDLTRGFHGPTARFRIGSEGDCHDCILRDDGPGLDVGLILATDQRGDEIDRGRDGFSLRYNPFDRGSFVVNQTRVWSCPVTGPCREIVRSATVAYEPLWPVLLLGVDNASGSMTIWRGWQRAARTAGEGDVAALAGRLLGRSPPAQPQNRAMVASRDGVERELALAAAEHREPVVPTLGLVLQPMSEGAAPLTSDQIAFLRGLVRHPTLERIPFNWTAHPDAAVRLAPELGRALEQSKGRPAFTADIQTALATLPPEPFIEQKGPILRWLRDAPSDPERFEDQAAPEFILRLAELGPEFAATAASRASAGRGWPETPAMTRALCRLGSQGRPAIAALRTVQAENAARRYPRNAPLEQAIARIEGEDIDRDACYRSR